MSIAVRELIETTCRSGNLLRASGISGSEGTRAHQKVQAVRPEHYTAELPVQHEVDLGPARLHIQGRIDGLYELSDGSLIVEEIKSTRRRLDEYLDGRPMHWAQAKIYGHILAAQRGLESVALHLTYVELDTWTTRTFEETASAAELAAFFYQLCETFRPVMERDLRWQAQRTQSIVQADFPHERPRRGQRQLMREVYLAIDRQQPLFAEAPTGIGKTLATLWPALQRLGDGRLDRIVFLTAKNSGKLIVQRAIADLQSTGLRVKSLTLTAKDQMSCVPGLRCDPITCENAIGFYNRLPAALTEMFQLDAWSPQRIREVAERHRLCPFEFSLHLVPVADILICDYNYVFDPRVALQRSFGESRKRTVILVDEAHNLVRRGRDMFSASLSEVQLKEVLRAIDQDAWDLTRVLKSLQRSIRAIRRQPMVQEDKPKTLLKSVRKLVTTGESWLQEELNPPWRELFVQFYFECNAFVQAGERFDESFRFYYEELDNKQNGRNLRLRLFCVDPSALLARVMKKRGRPCIFFSATLRPLDYFLDMLGAEPPFRSVQLNSPFPPEHLEVFAAETIPTTWRERENSIEPIAALIHRFVDFEPGNILVFFPSFAYLEQVLAACTFPNRELHVQQRGMDENQRTKFLAAFDRPSILSKIGFVVLGGSFGEGIDLVGDRLRAAIIVGVGLPQVCLEQDLIKQHMSETGKNGFDYAYTFPGMCRVLQAAGRVIRSAEDRGKILLIDQRYARETYRNLFPDCWPPIHWSRPSGYTALGE